MKSGGRCVQKIKEAKGGSKLFTYLVLKREGKPLEEGFSKGTIQHKHEVVRTTSQ